MSARLWRTSPTRGSRYSASTSVLPVICLSVSRSWLSVVCLAVGDVDDLTGDARGLRRAQVRVHDVGDVGEVARLFAVAVDDGALAGQQRRDEARDDAGILRAGVLPRAEDVEVAQGHRLEAVGARPHLTVELAGELRRRVGRERLRRHLLLLRQRRLVAVGRTRSGVDEAAHARRAAPRRAARIVASAHARCDSSGRSTERGTEGMAASWKTSSTPSSARRRSSASFKLPRTKSTSPPISSRFSRWPVERSSITRTRAPRPASPAAMCDPTKPAPPVTRTIP